MSKQSRREALIERMTIATQEQYSGGGYAYCEIDPADLRLAIKMLGGAA